MLAKIVSFEGHDKSGKETQSKLFTSYLNRIGKKAILIEVPYKEPIFYRLIYAMLKDGRAKANPNFFQLVHLLNKLVFQTFVLPFYAIKYDYIIFDRWSLSAYVYGSVTNVHVFLLALVKLLLINPMMTFVFYGKTFERFIECDDSYEKDHELQKNVKLKYVTESMIRSNHILVPNFPNRSVKEIHDDIVQMFHDQIEEKSAMSDQDI